MPSFHTLDIMAGSYNPTLALAALLLLGWIFYKSGMRTGSLALVRLIACISVVYGFMAIDRVALMHGWHGTHYSTHSAFAIAIVSFVVAYCPRCRITAIASLLAYLALVVHQRYHGIGDVVLTIVLVAPAVVGILRTAIATPKRVEASD